MKYSLIFVLVFIMTAGWNTVVPQTPEILTPVPGPAPRINGPLVYGCRPGNPFLYRIPCQGKRPIQFSVKGNGKLIGQNPVSAEAGIATILLQASAIPGNITVEAKAEGLTPVKINVRSVK